MKHLYTLVAIALTTNFCFAQSKISGTILDEKSLPMEFVPVILKMSKDSTLVKGAITNEQGKFDFENVALGSYFAEVSYLGYNTYYSPIFEYDGKITNLAEINMTENTKVMDEVVVTATRAIIEVKADRTIFNVQGTINSAGQNGINLLRKAPGVVVDNNNNINVLGRSGVLVYVDGKRLPLTGEDLTNYLQSLTAEQIDRIDIITSPGAKYEAQGNAGIIDIRLKKDQNLGTNGTISTNIGHGRYGSANANLSLNHRNKMMNIFGNTGGYWADNWNRMIFTNYQNQLRLEETNIFVNNNNGQNARFGIDFFLTKKSTIGFLVNVGKNYNDLESDTKMLIYPSDTSTRIDSILLSPNTGMGKRTQSTANLNYAYTGTKNKVSIDIDYGKYDNFSDNFQPNYYYNEDFTTLKSQRINTYSTPVIIGIGTAKIDWETNLFGGSFGAGAKYSDVRTDNTFLFFDVINNSNVRNDQRSNEFFYTEKVSAGYLSYNRKINEKWSLVSGLRAEQTDAQGDLNAFIPSLEAPPVIFDYLSWFPSGGLTYSYKPEHQFSLNYTSRINRPDYNVLNPFREQLSELSYSKGNENLRPEIVKNVELGYTLNYMYAFKLGYSRTDDQITRLIGPDEKDPRAGFISWDNLATQDLYVASASLPFNINKWWEMYVNATVSYTNNQADYGTDGKVDVQAGNYSVFQQSTFSLGKGFKGEISGWYSGPGVWGGVFIYEPQYSLDLGLQRKFLKEKLNARLSVQDVTFQSGWSGESNFNGLRGVGRGNWDSRRANLSLSYSFGNDKVKSRNRKTGIESEDKRVSK